MILLMMKRREVIRHRILTKLFDTYLFPNYCNHERLVKMPHSLCFACCLTSVLGIGQISFSSAR
jgi:hypothetical protein